MPHAGSPIPDTDAIVALTGRLVAIDSPTDAPGGVAAVCGELARAAHTAGCEVRLEPLAGCGPLLDATLRLGDGPQVLLLGHADTVWPVGTAAGWPFAAVDGWLHGPGVGDMKCCLATAIDAIGAIARVRPPGLGSVRLLVVPDEEAGSTRSRPAIEAAARAAAACLVLEAARPGGGVVTGRGAVGAMRIVATGGSGRHVTDEGAHPSALVPLAELVGPLERLAGVSVGRLHAGTARQVVPAEGELLVDLRSETTGGAQRLVAQVAALVAAADLPGGVSLTAEGGVTRPAWPRDAGSARLYALAETAARELGSPIHEVLERGGSDASLAGATGVPTLDGIGPICEHSCSRRERVEVASIPVWGTILERVIATAATA